jgi:hypothetical protein
MILTGSRNKMENKMENKIIVKIVLDSISPTGNRLTSFQVRIPKWLLQECNTHRSLSRSYSSARAIPAKRYRKSSNFSPVAWTANKPGMQGGKELEGWRLSLARFGWEFGRTTAKISHMILTAAGLHKQHTNRVLEAYSWADGIISGTEWKNFIKLRKHEDAQPEFYQLAEQISWLLDTNKPERLELGEWHLPFVDKDEYISCIELGYDPRLISGARCARVSYSSPDLFDTEKDWKRAQMLLSSNPKHVSPFEHVARCSSKGSGNYKGWYQYRHTIEKQK